jgi:hypothetical protein
LKDLCEYHETALLTPTRTGPVLVKEKWVYVFAKKGSGVSLFYECKPVVQGEKQTFEFVSWEADREKNQKSYPRPTTGKSKDTFELQPDREYYVLISQIQLSLARIDYYTQHADKLAKRALHIAANTLKSNSAPVSLYCTDYIEIAFYLREQYDKHVQSFEKFVSDKEKVQRRYLAGLVCAVAESKPRLKGWIDYNAVVKERDQNEQETKERLRGKETAEAHLRDWKLSRAFELTREDYAGTKEIEEAILAHDAVLTSVDEIRYLESEGVKKESWYNMIFTADSRFLFFRKLDTLAAADKFWDIFGKHIVARYLANYGPTKFKGVQSVDALVQRMERFVDELHVITEHAKLTFPDLVQNKGRWFYVTIDEHTKLPVIDYEFMSTTKVTGHSYNDTMKYRPAKRKWNAIREGGIDKALPSLQKILIGFEIVNLANSIYALAKADSIKDKGFGFINFAGSIADMISSLDKIGKRQITSLKVNAGMAPDKAAIYADRAFAIVNLAGAVCDYAGALKDIYESSAQGKNGLSFGYATIAVSAVATGTSAVMTIGATSAQLAGAETAAMFTSAMGMSSATLGVVGVVLFFAGAGINLYFADNEFHEWAKKSAWRKDGILDYVTSGGNSHKSSIDSQIEELHKLICEFTPDCYLYKNQLAGTEIFTQNGSVLHKHEYIFTAAIRPGYYNEKASKYKVNLKIIREGGSHGHEKVLLDNAFVLFASQEQKLQSFEGDTFAVLLKRFTTMELNLEENFQEHKFSYELTAWLDFYGDGSAILFKTEKKGAVKIKERDV